MSAPIQEWTTEDVVAGLRRWTAHQQAHVRAAVELLIEHETWPRRRDFLRAVVEEVEGVLRVRWTHAEAFVETARGSTSELSILQLAIAVGTDRYGLRVLGSWGRAAVVRAVTAAVAE